MILFWSNISFGGGWFLLLDGVICSWKKEDELDGVLDSYDVEFGTPSNKYISLSDMKRNDFHGG